MDTSSFNATAQEAVEQPEEAVSSFNGEDDLTKDGDLCIVCKDGERLYVHRLILSKWSHVVGKCPGVQQGTLPSPVVDFSVEETAPLWREVLGIIYPSSPVTIIGWENVGRIFALADKYEMPGVLQRCEAFLLSSGTSFSTSRLRNDYVLKWLAFAAQYRQKALAEKCMQFIRLNYRSIEELRSSPEKCYLRDVLATTQEGVHYIIEILQFVMQQRR